MSNAQVLTGQVINTWNAQVFVGHLTYMVGHGTKKNRKAGAFYCMLFLRGKKKHFQPSPTDEYISRPIYSIYVRCPAPLYNVHIKVSPLVVIDSYFQYFYIKPKLEYIISWLPKTKRLLPIPEPTWDFPYVRHISLPPLET